MVRLHNKGEAEIVRGGGNQTRQIWHQILRTRKNCHSLNWEFEFSEMTHAQNVRTETSSAHVDSTWRSLIREHLPCLSMSLSIRVSLPFLEDGEALQDMLPSYVWWRGGSRGPHPRSRAKCGTPPSSSSCQTPGKRSTFCTSALVLKDTASAVLVSPWFGARIDSCNTCDAPVPCVRWHFSLENV